MRRVPLVILSALLLSTACSGERPTFEDGAAREVEAAEVIADAPADPVTVRVAVPEGWSLDPTDAGPASLTNRVLADLLYEGLITLADDGTPTPGLADRWSTSDDRLNWTFLFPDSLADGAGRPITARDVKASLERVAALGPADAAATSMTAVRGWADRMTGAAGGVAGISAPDETTLVIQLDQPYELLPEVLASPAFGIALPDDTGALRTTGSFAATDDPTVFTAVDPAASVGRLELVTASAGPATAVADDLADWGVVSPDESVARLDALVIRQPLDLELAMVARSPIEDVRLGLLGTLEPLSLATAVDGLVGRPIVERPARPTPPGAALVEVPSGVLGTLAEAAVNQLEAEGVAVWPVASDMDEFAGRVASGDALLFPIVVAGGTGPSSAVVRLGVPGGTDDVFGPESDARAELAEAVVTEIDVERRALFAGALEQTLIDEGLLLPIGQFEVRVAMSRRLNGLEHRLDGTLDLSAVERAEP